MCAAPGPHSLLLPRIRTFAFILYFLMPGFTDFTSCVNDITSQLTFSVRLLLLDITSCSTHVVTSDKFLRMSSIAPHRHTPLSSLSVMDLRLGLSHASVQSYSLPGEAAAVLCVLTAFSLPVLHAQ